MSLVKLLSLVLESGLIIAVSVRKHLHLKLGVKEGSLLDENGKLDPTLVKKANMNKGKK